MKIEKLPSGNYRVRKMYKGKNFTINFDHKPNQKEIALAMAEKLENVEDVVRDKSATFAKAIDDYITMRTNILSPSTITGYTRIKNLMSKSFLDTNVFDITQEDIQREVNAYANTHSPKSVRNFHGLISAVMGMKRPNMRINTTLPEKEYIEAVIPTHEAVMKILEALKGTKYYIPVYLGCHGLRRSEIIALTVDDLDGNILTIDKALVKDVDNEFVLKKTKSYSGTRTIAIAEELADAIRKQGYIYKGYPNSILRALKREQDRLGIPQCKLHELRHFYVSYAHDLGMSDANITYSVGHKTDEITKRVYRHKMNHEAEQKRIAESLTHNMTNS